MESASPGHIYTVSELTAELKDLLEKRYHFVWIRAEISNFRIPVSGHFYFALKDEESLIRAVMFRGQNRGLRFRPEDGMRILALGRISLYPPRGEYQLIVEHLEPEGVGALQVAFEQLKEKLFHEGLFNESRKKALPFLPSRICLVTSPSGSVLFDMLQIIGRRFPGLDIDIAPVKVQGDEAAPQIAETLGLINRRSGCDVIILARGGGSMEDLWPFNTEIVARAIAASQIPVISAIGHETDHSIADMVADVRAPTPSAAAEIVAPRKDDLVMRCDELHARMIRALRTRLEDDREMIISISRRLVDPRQELKRQVDHLEEIDGRMRRALLRMVEIRRHLLETFQHALISVNPNYNISQYKAQLDNYCLRAGHCMRASLNQNRARLQEIRAKLEALDPLAILERGYSVTRRRDSGKIITNASTARLGQELEILLARGKLTARTTGRELQRSVSNPSTKHNG